MKKRTEMIVGGRPVGLMEAEATVAGGANIKPYDVMPLIGRSRFLIGAVVVAWAMRSALPIKNRSFWEMRAACAS